MYNQFYPQYPSRYSGQVLRVNGRQGADAFQMMPNSSALLLDETAPIVWLVQTDAAGYKSMTPFDTMPHQEPKQTSLEDIESRMQRLEELIHEQSNVANAARTEQPTKSADGYSKQSKGSNEF